MHARLPIKLWQRIKIVELSLESLEGNEIYVK